MSEPDFKDVLFEQYNIRTDLALESHQVIVEQDLPPELPGVKVHTEEEEGITITRITVENDIGAQMMGKAPGNYATIEAPGLRTHNREIQERIALTQRYLALQRGAYLYAELVESLEKLHRFGGVTSEPVGSHRQQNVHFIFSGGFRNL